MAKGANVRARLFDESGRPLETEGDLHVDDGTFVIVTGHPGLGPIRAFVFDGCFFGETDEQCYARYREGAVSFTQLKEVKP